MIFPRSKTGIRSRPHQAPIEQVRISRPTRDIDRVLRFYVNGLGLELLDGVLEDRYRGAVVGLPDRGIHLFFTQACDVPPQPPDGNCYVFYVPGTAASERIVDRLRALGFPLVESDNTYWARDGFIFEDPDGWQVIVMARPGI